MIKRMLLFVCIAAIATFCLADAALAGTLKIGQGSKPEYAYASGGEFVITSFSGGYYVPQPFTITTNADFHTFCLEKNEGLAGGLIEWSADFEAQNGGVGGSTGTGDPLHADTAKLVYTWWTNAWGKAAAAGVTDSNGDTVSYSYSLNRGTDTDGTALQSGDLQEAIWHLEQEWTAPSFAYHYDNVLSDEAKIFVDYARNVSWSDLGKSYGSTSIGMVRVLNLWNYSGPGGAKKLLQSQLILLPLPAPALMGFALLGALGVAGVVRRRRRQRSFS